MIRHIRSALLGAFALLLVSAIPAFAHSELVESNPADGATIETPFTLRATFSEDFDPERSFLRVQTAAGEVVAEATVSEDDPLVMTVDLPALDPGAYTVRWQTTTPDDNGVERGTYTFNVGAPATPSPSPTAAPTARAGPTASPTAPPSASRTPVATSTPVQPTPGSGGDALLAVVIGVVVIGAIALFLFARSRR